MNYYISGSYNNEEPNNSNTLRKKYLKIVCNDYEAIEDLDEYGSVVVVESTCLLQHYRRFHQL